jgi:predicted nucleic acid-binding protein
VTAAPVAAVVDASVAIKWVVAEMGSERSLALAGSRLVAPDLLLVECANVLWKKVRRHELSDAEAGAAAALLEAADIELVPARGLMERTVALACALDHPAYDCCYLAVAEARSLPLVTADEALVRVVGGAKGLAWMRVLALSEID